MPRIVSVWLPQWPVHRYLAAERRRPSSGPADPPIDRKAPFVLAGMSDTPRIAALNPAAEACGLAVGDRLADARARIGTLQVRSADPAADTADLERLAHWATRYTPSVALYREHNGTDGFFLDVTGASHLMGGEDKLLADLARRLNAFGLPTRLAAAATPGAAWAISHGSRTNLTSIAAGAEANALTPLPVEALRLSPEAALTLRRLGFKRIGSLIGKPRAPFAARFERELLRRLDQALGVAPEPLSLLAPPPVYARRRSLLEPISTEDAIVIAAERLMQDLVPALEADGVGARAVCLDLYRVDGLVQRIEVGLTAATQNPAHIVRLIRLKLDSLEQAIEAGFGFETVSLAVTVAERLQPRQAALAAASDDRTAEQSNALLDALKQRLGPEAVHYLAPIASHWPERSEILTDQRSEILTDQRSETLVNQRSETHLSATGEAPAWPDANAHESRPRPPLLMPRAEPADVIALAPDGPPHRFRWRGTVHSVTRAEGPERIAGEWWRSRTPQPTRDYYLVEDGAGHRFWLYREGIPGRETATPRWFVHGLFA